MKNVDDVILAYFIIVRFVIKNCNTKMSTVPAVSQVYRDSFLRIYITVFIK